jgi:hypothetical protein
MVQVKLSLLLNYAPHHEDLWQSEGILHSFVTALDSHEWSVLPRGRDPPVLIG